MRGKHAISERSACRLVGLSRAVLQYQAKARLENEQLRGRRGQLAGERRRFGYRRPHLLVRREGWFMNRKRTRRLYREGKLHVQRRRKRGLTMVERQQLVLPTMPDVTRSMDFIFDRVGETSEGQCGSANKRGLLSSRAWPSMMAKCVNPLRRVTSALRNRARSLAVLAKTRSDRRADQVVAVAGSAVGEIRSSCLASASGALSKNVCRGVLP